MKLNSSILLLFVFITFLCSPRNGTSQSRSEESVLIKEYFNYAPLNQVFDSLQSKYGMHIKFNPDQVKPYRFTYLFTGTRPEQAIKICLNETPLSYSKDEKGNYLIFDPKVDIENKKIAEETRYAGPSKHKNFSIRGVVKDLYSGESLPYVNITLSGTTQGTNTNIDGYFTLVDVPRDTMGLSFSYIGYSTKTFYLKPNLDFNNLAINMVPQNQVLDEVIIAADREELLRANEKISMLKLSPSKIAALPSIGEKDVMRSFQLMPGVSAANENSSGLYVRGGTPDQTLVLYDGFNVYHVEHLFGFFSAFNPNAIKDVQLYKGGFESKFGGRISSVAEITGKEGNSKQTNLGINAGFLAANAIAEIPIGDKITTLIAARHSYQSSLYQKIFNKYAGTTNQVTPVGFGGGRRGFNIAATVPKSFFYDLNGRVTYRPTDKDIITASFFNGTDNMDNSRANVFGGLGSGGGPGNFGTNINDKTNWGNTGGSLKWSHRFSQKFYLNALASYSNYFSTRDRTSSVTRTDSTGNEINSRIGSLEDNNLVDYSGKIDMEYKLNAHNFIEFGLNTTYNHIDYTYLQNDTTHVIDRHTQGTTTSAYIQDKIDIGKLSVVPGLRYNYFSPTAKTYAEPRISASYIINDRLKLKGAFGYYYQFVKRVIREDILQGSRDFWVLADDQRLPVSRAVHHILGLSYELPKWLIDVEAYSKDLSGLSEYSVRIRPSPRSLVFDEKFTAGDGVAKGIDFLLQKKYGKLNGWVSYSLGSVKYNFVDYGKPFYANQDVRNELKIVSIYSIKGWDFSGTMIYATGRPYTAPTGGYQLTLLDGAKKDFITVTDKNGLRLPAYNRFDLAATYNWKSAKGAPRNISMSLFNVLNRTNTWYKEFQIESGQVVETNVNFLGFTPNLSVSWYLH
ncbi:MAG: TonB-dependent receptor [Saprospiraceae bacterium]